MRDRRLAFEKHERLVQLVESYRGQLKVVKRLAEEERQELDDLKRGEITNALRIEEAKLKALRRKMHNLYVYLAEVRHVS